MDYFIINQEKIFIEIKNTDIILKKYINGVLIQLNENQKNEILNELQSKNGYNYDTQMLIELMQANPSLNSNFDYYYNFLSYIEGIIPDKYRTNFYNNLKTLQIELNLDVEPTKNDDSKFYTTCGGYNTKDNKIVMRPESIIKTKEISKVTNDPNTFFGNILIRIYYMSYFTWLVPIMIKKPEYR